MEKKLPDLMRLRALRAQGKTYKQIALWVEAKTGERVSPASVGAALSRAGVTKARPRYEQHLPWVVHTDHIKHYAARMLRLLGRRDNGLPMSEENTKRLDSWLARLRQEGLIVAYLPDSEAGFHYVSGEWPQDGIPIVRPSRTNPGDRRYD